VGTGTIEETERYFYHSDHLGSTSYITDASGNAIQYVSYMPFGETFIEEHTSYDSPYKFNGKEMDAETGLYYYGARYYDPRMSMFYGVDPLADKYCSISPYIYCSNNPIRRIDPDGRHDYQLDYETGNINLIKETEANTHTIYASKADGKIDKGNSIEVSKDVLNFSTQQSVQVKEGSYNTNTYTIFNGDQAENFFEFAANNSNVEWTNVSASFTDNSITTNYSLVTTSHEYGTDVSINGIINQMNATNNMSAVTQEGTYNINKLDHNHTNGSTTPSGQPLSGNKSSGDVGVAQSINKLNGNNNAVFRIYSPQTRTYHSFSANDTPWDLKGVEIFAPRKR
jgi:RHS repeat-associated protein